MFCENRIVIAFDFLIAPCIPQIGLHADRLHIVCKFPDMIPQSALGDDARYAAAVFFLIVAGVMFDGRSDPVLSLHTACESCCDDSDQNFD